MNKKCITIESVENYNDKLGNKSCIYTCVFQSPKLPRFTGGIELKMKPDWKRGVWTSKIRLNT